MKYSFHHNLLLMTFILMLLTGCATFNTQKVDPTTIMKARKKSLKNNCSMSVSWFLNLTK